MGFDQKAALREIARLEEQQSKLKNRLNVLTVRLQKHCKHPAEHVREGEMIHFFTGGATPPFRVCILCGYAEEGWFTGYWRLHNSRFDIAKLSRDEAYKFVRRFLTRTDIAEQRPHLFSKAVREALARGRPE